MASEAGLRLLPGHSMGCTLKPVTHSTSLLCYEVDGVVELIGEAGDGAETTKAPPTTDGPPTEAPGPGPGLLGHGHAQSYEEAQRKHSG